MDNDNNVKMENKEPFNCLLIKPDDISNLSFADPYYANKVAKLDTIVDVTILPEQFMPLLSKYLELDKYKFEGLNISSDIIGEEPDYVYELYYVDLKDKNEFHTKENMLASLLTTNGEKIYSNAILFRTYLKPLTDSMLLVDSNKKDLERLIFDRGYTKIVTFDGEEWKEEAYFGELKIFAEKFLEDNNFKKKSLGFLVHNIHIWYTDDFGEKNVCGKLLDCMVERCIIFTMKTEDIRGSITLNEVKKIIELSNQLTTFLPPEDLIKERFDSLGRKVINNRYKILDYMYSKLNK